MKHCTRCGAALSDDALFCLKCGQSQVATGEDSIIGTIVAERYLVKARVGSGGSGTVYDARHVTLQQRMALKLLHHHLCQDPVAVERFRREATTVTHLDHPHIIGMRDFGSAEDGRLFLAMEFLEGRTLAEALLESSPFTVPRALDIVAQVVGALTEAHQSGYVHRDLRPRNVFLTTRRGREDFVKVMDFGLAKLMLHELEPGQATVGMSFGDPAYLSPEQASGEAADQRTDVYALGVMVYEMLTGVPPLVGDDVFATINMHLRVKPEPPSRRNASLPHAFDTPVLKALAKKSDERWETVEAFQEALRRAVGSTTAPGLGTPGGKPRRDQTQPAIPSRMRESTELAAVDPLEPGKTALGLGPLVSLPLLASRDSPPTGDGAPSRKKVAATTSIPHPTTDAENETSEAGKIAPAPAHPPVSDMPVPRPQPAPAPIPPLVKPPEASPPPPAPPMATSHPAPAAAPPPFQAPATGDAEVPDPTMSQMWYSAGEAEAAEAMAEYEELLRETGGRPADLTEPVLITSGALDESPARRTRAILALVLVALLLAMVVVVVILLSRHPKAPQSQTGPTHQVQATMETGAPTDTAALSSDASLKVSQDARTESPADARAVIVLDMAVQIDAPEPGMGKTPLPRQPGRPRVAPDRPPSRPDAGLSMGSGAAQAVVSGQRALARGDTTAAQMEFQRALTLQPGNAHALAGLGEVDFELGQYARAATRLQTAARAMPSSVKIWVLLGNARFRSGRYREAQEAFRTALRLSPGHAEAKRNLELVERRLGGSP